MFAHSQSHMPIVPTLGFFCPAVETLGTRNGEPNESIPFPLHQPNQLVSIPAFQDKNGANGDFLFAGPFVRVTLEYCFGGKFIPNASTR